MRPLDVLSEKTQENLALARTRLVGTLATWLWWYGGDTIR